MRHALATWLVVLGGVVLGVTPAGAQHAGHAQGPPQETAPDPAPASASGESPHQAAPGDLPPFIPPVTEEDRRAAFPQDVEGHAVHDRAINYFVLFDQLESRSDPGGTALNVDTKGWVGGDLARLWFRAEVDGEDGRIEEAEAHLLYGRRVSRWWEVVGGIRQDLEPGPSRAWAAVGIQGLAPYRFEIELTGYVGASGRTQVRGEVEYELLLTNRLVLQPLVEVNVFGRSDPERGVGAGLGTTDAGMRVRYEFRRELAPYVGVTWNSKWGETADIARAAGKDTGGARFVAGLRLWY
jgi:copper resistance protein B